MDLTLPPICWGRPPASTPQAAGAQGRWKVPGNHPHDPSHTLGHRGEQPPFVNAYWALRVCLRLLSCPPQASEEGQGGRLSFLHEETDAPGATPRPKTQTVSGGGRI